MADEIDLAQQRDEQFREMSLQKQLSNRQHGPSLDTCCVCGGDIPEARQLAVPGVIKCYGCQLEYEQMHGRGM